LALQGENYIKNKHKSFSNNNTFKTIIKDNANIYDSGCQITDYNSLFNTNLKVKIFS